MGDVFYVCGVCGRKDNKTGRCEYCGPLFARIRREVLDEVERESHGENYDTVKAVHRILRRLRDKPEGTND